MKIERFSLPHSSFLSMEKDMSIITDKILSCDRLKKLLYYTSPDALDRPSLTIEQSNELFGKNIRIVPKLTLDGTVLNYIVITFTDFTINPTNPEFRNNVIEFDIICHFDQWQLKDFQLRPFRIAAELDSMLDKQHLTGIGDLLFAGAKKININDEFCGVCLKYLAIHGEEDKKGMPNPQDQSGFVKAYRKQHGLEK